jgi:hypothetical protein
MVEWKQQARPALAGRAFRLLASPREPGKKADFWAFLTFVCAGLRLSAMKTRC